MFIKQYHEQVPEFMKPLGRLTHAIWLLQLLPTDDPSNLRLRRFIADSRVAEYTALSHISTDMLDYGRKVLINDDQVVLSMKLVTFLQKLLRQSRNTLYWIDEVCELDPSSSCLRRDEIYFHASKVVVLMDTCETFSSKGSDGRPSTSSQEKIGHDDRVTLLLKIAENEYWTHPSVLREFLPARDVLFKVRSSHMSISDFVTLYLNVDTAKTVASREETSVLRRMKPFLRFARSATHLYSGRTKRPTDQLLIDQPLQIRFEELLESFQHLKYRAPYDRILSLRGISDSTLR